MISFVLLLSLNLSNDFNDMLIERVLDKYIIFELAGKSTHTEFFVELYEVTHYLQRGHSLSKIEDIPDADIYKKLIFKLTHNTSAKIIITVIEKYTNKSEKYNKEIAELEKLFTENNLEKGQIISVTHIPKVGIICQVKNGDNVLIKNEEFGKAIWRMFFGEKCLDDNVKKELFEEEK